MLAGSCHALLSDYEVQGWEVGSVQLKGVAEQMSIVQFIHQGSSVVNSNDNNSQALAMHLASQQSTMASQLAGSSYRAPALHVYE